MCSYLQYDSQNSATIVCQRLYVERGSILQVWTTVNTSVGEPNMLLATAGSILFLMIHLAQGSSSLHISASALDTWAHNTLRRTAGSTELNILQQYVQHMQSLFTWFLKNLGSICSITSERLSELVQLGPVLNMTKVKCNIAALTPLVDWYFVALTFLIPRLWAL